MMQFEATLDPLSISVLSRFEQMDLLPGAVQAGLAYSGQIVLNRAVQYTWQRFANPTGRLAGSLQVVRDNPYSLTVGSDLPYAHRRDYPDYHGPDALGRVFPNEHGFRYATDALIDSEQEIGERMATTISAALDRLAGGR